MSWMTKEGSSSASGQSPPHSLPNELARFGGASTRVDGAVAAAHWDCVVDGRYKSQAGNTTRRAESRTDKAVGKPPAKGVVYPFEGFG